MIHDFKVAQFEGPLDLLLSLIEEQKLDITQIALARVTEQFLNYIKQLTDLDPTILADYLAIAAKLLVIKSKAILPSLEVESEEDDAGADLATKLLLYKQFKETAKLLKSYDNRRRQSFTPHLFPRLIEESETGKEFWTYARPASQSKGEGFTRSLAFEERINFYPDPTISTQELYQSILLVLKGLKELDSLPKARIREAVSIQEKIDHLQILITQQVEAKLSDLLAASKNKSEAIVTFLALLELIKQKILTVEQENLFAEITIKQYQAQNPNESGL